MKRNDPKGYYAVLGIAPTATSSEIKAAYRRRAMDLHPDRNTSSTANSEFQLLSEAYAMLGDPEARAAYDTSSLESNSERTDRNGPGAFETPPEPISCSCCGRVTAQPRYVIFYEVMSFVLVTRRSTIQGIFCRACAERKAYRASAVTWLLGWWGIPWGAVYSVWSLGRNLVGGERPATANVRLLMYQAWVFSRRGNRTLARAVLEDARRLAGDLRPDLETKIIREDLERLSIAFGPAHASERLKDSWLLLGRPLYVQGGIAASIALLLVGAIAHAPRYSPSPGPKHYRAGTALGGGHSVGTHYVKPKAAPNGVLWPATADYVAGYPRERVGGLSSVTVDNTQNDVDVFVKLVSLDGPVAVPARVFFVPAHAEFLVSQLVAGSYDIRYRDLDTGRLSRSESFTLDETTGAGETRYSEFTMTLYKVAHGNAHFYDLADSEF